MEMAQAQEAEPVEEPIEEEAPEEQPEADGAGKEKKGGSKLIFVVLAVLLLGGGGFGAKKFLLKGPEKGKEEAKPTQEHHEPGPIVDLGEEFVINLRGGGYVRAKVALELGVELKGGGHGGGGGSDFMPPLRDLVITVLSGKSRSDLTGAEGKERTKTELIERINEEFAGRGHEGFAQRAYFTYLAVQ